MPEHPPPSRRYPGGRGPVDLTFSFAQSTVMADGVVETDSIQAAVDQAEGAVLIGPGDYAENVSVSTAGLNIIGAGSATHLNPAAGAAFDVTADNVSIRHLRSSAPANAVTSTGARTRARRVDATVNQTDGVGFQFNGASSGVRNCYVSESYRGVVAGAAKCRVIDSVIGFPTAAVSEAIANVGIAVGGTDVILKGNHIKGSDHLGVNLFGAASNCILSFNLAENCYSPGFRTAATNTTMTENIAINTGGFNTSSATTPTLDNNNAY